MERITQTQTFDLSERFVYATFARIHTGVNDKPFALKICFILQ